MRCSDEHLYIVKFRNNPQHPRVLANELLATRLAECAGLPVPVTMIVEVGKWLVKHTPELHVQLPHGVIQCQPGLQFGSRYVASPRDGPVFDYFPTEMLGRVQNLETFLGMLVVDKWTGNTDLRQAAFWRRRGEPTYTATFIDQGDCFNAGKWTFPDDPLRGVYTNNQVYAAVQGWESFEPWLSRIETMEHQIVWGLAREIPPEWYGGERNELETLVVNLLRRRGAVRDLIGAFRASVRNPFPAWQCEAKGLSVFSRSRTADRRSRLSTESLATFSQTLTQRPRRLLRYLMSAVSYSRFPSTFLKPKLGKNWKYRK